MSFTLLTSAVEAIARILSRRARKQLGQEALLISQREPESKERLLSLFDKTKKRLAWAWMIGMGMTIVLFVLFIGMLITAIASGVVWDKPIWSIVFGTVSGGSLLSVILWKPFEKAFQATATVQILEMIIAGLEQEWAACSAIQDPLARVNCIREANQVALEQIAKLSSS